MKTKYTFLTGMAMFAMSSAFCQIEHDDMYFNSKDRAKLNARRQELLAKQYREEDMQTVRTAPINPTDSYSGRSVNPEYTNRLKTNPNLTNTNTTPQYFVSGYQPTNVNQNLSSNTCNCTGSNYFNGNNYGYGGYGMNSYYGMNSGFGSPYSSFYSPWGMNSFYQPGWSSMVGYSYGGMNSGWYSGMGYGYGNSWGSPYSYGYGGSSFYNSYGYGYGSGYYGSNTAIYNNSGDSHNPVVYGKRANRSSDTDNVIDHSRVVTAGSTRTGRVISSGRSGSDNQTSYYDRGWKRDPDKNPSRSYWSDTNSTSSGSSSSNSRSGWDNSNSSSGRQSSSSGGNDSRSSFNSGSSFGGGGSRSSSSGSSSGGGGSHSSGGHSRGRD